MTPIALYDTTLRDGSQGENIAFSAEEKLFIAKKLDSCGFDYIEGGWPGSNPKDVKFFEMARKVSFGKARLTAFGATRKPGVAAGEDPNLNALLDSEAPVLTIFGKSWKLHVERIMDNTLEENLAMIRDSVAYLKSFGREVVYDAEHFFDGIGTDREYAMATVEAAAGAGADWIVLCDTNGGSLPFGVEAETRAVIERLAALSRPGDPPPVGIHTHNDSALAVANAIAAVRAGAVMVQGTVNGYGERCGNADMTSVIPVLKLKMGLDCVSDEELCRLRGLSRFVSETANQVPLSSRPFVGSSAFAHKGGIHVNAVMKDPRAYEHIDPSRVGNRRRVLVSDLSGRSNVEYKVRELGIDLDGQRCDSREIVTRIKELEDQGYQFDAADGSFKMLVERLAGHFESLFELESFRVSIEKDEDRPCSAHATIKIAVGGSREITAAEGHGPVSALDNALRKALTRFYPELKTMRLVDFKVRVIDGNEGTAARVRVLIASRDQEEIWNTIGVSEDIIEASWRALTDSFHYKLTKERSARARFAGTPHQTGRPA